MELAWLGAVVIGLSLGLFGSGGSLLTVPVLAFLVGQHEKVAIAGSLAIAGAISLVASVPYALRRQIEWRSVLAFGLPGMVGTGFGAWASRFVSGRAQLWVFAAVVLAAAIMMLGNRGRRRSPEAVSVRPWMKIAVDGALVGIVTGFAGVGGGFLIVPALVVLGGLPMHRAVGTSLIIIALKSAVGFFTYAGVLTELGLALDGAVVGQMVLLGIAGSVMGCQVSARLPHAALRQGFAAFLVLIGGYVVVSTALI